MTEDLYQMFDRQIQRRNTNCFKYDGLKQMYGKEDLLSLWVADMDFEVPESVAEAVKKRAEHAVYGYNMMPDSYFEAFVSWVKKHHQWHVEKEWLSHTPGVLAALSVALLAFTKEGDEILIQPPVYFPFKMTIEALGRKTIVNQLKYSEGRFSMDLDDLAEKAKTAKLFILCSPHNPSGRVWTEEEMKGVESICRQKDLLVFSDEIHCDIVYEPDKHIVFGKMSQWAEDHSIIAMAPSKTFNIAGLEMSVIAIKNTELRAKFQTLLGQGLHMSNPNTLGLVAAEAAYAGGEEWYQTLLKYLKDNLNYLDGELKRRVPAISLVYPEATYIPLLDLRALNMKPEKMRRFFIEDVGAALNDGVVFGTGGEQFMRINVGTQRRVLEEFVKRLEKAVSEL